MIGTREVSHGILYHISTAIAAATAVKCKIVQLAELDRHSNLKEGTGTDRNGKVIRT
jgi:hypothetical protein